MRTYLTAELSRGDIENIANQVATNLSKSQWTAELVDTLVAKVTSAVVERLGKTGTDLTDVACHRVAAVVNERLAKTLAAKPPIPETAYARLSNFIRDSVTVDASEATTDYADIAIRVIRDQRVRIAELSDRISSESQQLRAELKRLQEGVVTDQQKRIRDLESQLAAAHDETHGDCITGERAVAVQLKLLKAEALVTNLAIAFDKEPIGADLRALERWIISIKRVLVDNKS